MQEWSKGQKEEIGHANHPRTDPQQTVPVVQFHQQIGRQSGDTKACPQVPTMRTGKKPKKKGDNSHHRQGHAATDYEFTKGRGVQGFFFTIEKGLHEDFTENHRCFLKKEERNCSTCSR